MELASLTEEATEVVMEALTEANSQTRSGTAADEEPATSIEDVRTIGREDLPSTASLATSHPHHPLVSETPRHK